MNNLGTDICEYIMIRDIRYQELVLILRQASIYGWNNKRDDIGQESDALLGIINRQKERGEMNLGADFEKRFGHMFPYALASTIMEPTEIKKQVCDIICRNYQCMGVYDLSSVIAVAKIAMRPKLKQEDPFYRLYAILRMQQKTIK